jgi:hypothetical protein
VCSLKRDEIHPKCVILAKFLDKKPYFFLNFSNFKAFSDASLIRDKKFEYKNAFNPVLKRKNCFTTDDFRLSKSSTFFLSFVKS